MRFAPLAFLLLAPAVRGQSTCELKPSQIPGFRIWEAGQSGFTQGKEPGDLTFSWGIRFKNETPREIGSATVRLVAVEGGRRTFVSQPVTIHRFINTVVAHAGSLLPYEKSEGDGSLRFDMPGRLWMSDTRMDLELVSATGFVNPDLHDAGHLYTRLAAGRGGTNISILKRDPSLLKVRNAQGTTTTLMAFGCCDTATIRYVLAHGGNPRERTVRGATIMHLAAANGWPEVLDLAKSLGGDPNARTASGRTPLMKAIEAGQPVGWRWLLVHGAKTDLVATNGESAAYDAIHEGQAGALADLVKAGASPRWRDPKGDGWLEYAIGNYVFMDEVGKYRCPIDARNPKTGLTPLMLATRHGGEQPIVWFLRHGANPDLKDRKGKTAYDYARENNTLHTDRFFRRLVAQYAVKKRTY